MDGLSTAVIAATTTVVAKRKKRQHRSREERRRGSGVVGEERLRLGSVRKRVDCSGTRSQRQSAICMAEAASHR